MLGLMQRREMMISSILRHAALHHATAEIVSRTTEGDIHRMTYAEAEPRCRRLVRVLQRLGVKPGDRVATLAWNGYRHFELYYALSGMGAIVHTVNPRLSPDDIAYILDHAGSIILCADTTFAPLVAAIAPRLASVGSVVMLADADHMPDIALAPGMRLLCYETLMAEADEDYDWPDFDENTASALCYTSGTTGRPKGVLYSHRSTILHAYGVNLSDTIALRAVDRVLPVVPMFHVNAWGLPYAAPMVGASLIFPGRYLDGPSLHALLNRERVTLTSGVPTVWLGLLQHLQTTGGRLDTLRRLMTGGSACPRVLLDGFAALGVHVEQGWGMTEISPVGTYNRPTQATASLQGEDEIRLRLKQGRMIYGLEMRITDDAGQEVPRDGVHFGNLEVRGHWVCSSYFGETASPRADGWFPTGDVATIDPDGFMQITDRTKDVVKSGGEWISSIQLENIAVSHPDVAEAAIIGAKHPKWDERPLLLVVPKEGRTIDPAALLAIYEGQVAKWWIPDDVVIVETLPHTATGKLQKMTLRTRYQDHYL